MTEKEKALQFLAEKGISDNDFMETGTTDYIAELIAEYSWKNKIKNPFELIRKVESKIIEFKSDLKKSGWKKFPSMSILCEMYKQNNEYISFNPESGELEYIVDTGELPIKIFTIDYVDVIDMDDILSVMRKSINATTHARRV